MSRPPLSAEDIGRFLAMTVGAPLSPGDRAIRVALEAGETLREGQITKVRYYLTTLDGIERAQSLSAPQRRRLPLAAVEVGRMRRTDFRASYSARRPARRPERRSTRKAARCSAGTSRRASSSSRDDDGGGPEPPEPPGLPAEVEPRPRMAAWRAQQLADDLALVAEIRAFLERPIAPARLLRVEVSE